MHSYHARRPKASTNTDVVAAVSAYLVLRESPDYPAPNLQFDDPVGAMPAHEFPQLPVKFARRLRVHAVAGEAIAGVEGFDIGLHRLSKRHGCRRLDPDLLEKTARCEFLG